MRYKIKPTNYGIQLQLRSTEELKNHFVKAGLTPRFGFCVWYWFPRFYRSYFYYGETDTKAGVSFTFYWLCVHAYLTFMKER